MKLLICNQTCHLLPSRAIFWEEAQTLILADVHLGKSAVFRRFGIPIPEGTHANDLSKLMILIKEFKPKKCVVVGDLIHAKSGLSEDIKKQFSGFLIDAGCETHLVMGNHDRTLMKNMPKEWPLYLHKEILTIEPFHFSHFPIPLDKGLVWSGHLHPKIEVKNKHDRIVLRCFQLFPHLGILPAFGEFVGGTFIKKNSECLIYAIAESEIIKI